MNEDKIEIKEKKPALALWKGIVLSNVFAMTVIGLQSTFDHDASEGVLIFSEFIIIPLLMGIISTWCWRNIELKGKQLTGYAVVNGLVGMLLSFIFLGEGAICLLIVSPLILGSVITGSFIGQGMFKKKNQTLNVSIISILLTVFVADALSEHDHQNMVSDELIIDASPEEVWPHVVAFEKIEKKEDYWLFKIGMPSPMATTVSGHELGANRKCIFSNGYIFDETIVAYDVNRNLTFDIVDQPKDPEIMGHIDIKRGQFLLKDNGDGTTTLIGNSWYKLHVFPVWYYDMWAESITRNVHFRVMKHIKSLSEAS